MKVFNLDKKMQQAPGGDPSWFGLIKKILFYAPCAIINIVEYYYISITLIFEYIRFF